MNTVCKVISWKKGLGRLGIGAVAGLALFGAGSRSFADPPYAMAPPVDSTYAPTTDSTSVFGWQDVPLNQRVPIRRGAFDQGGYQLYDTVGETIVVPFTNQNLYVMKFGMSDDGTTYFVNDGDTPVLYIPRNGYLENAAVSGSRWYPFPKEFHESTPVFIGIAPSWDDFCGMGWYPDMVCYGGYWGRDSFIAGGIFLPTFGLTFVIGDHHYDGWEPYHHYYDYHPAPYRVTIVNRRVYNIYNDRERRFDGHRDYSAFHGTGRPFDAGRPDGRGGDRAFLGTGHPYYAHQTDSGSHDFRSIRPATTAPNHTFNGGGDRTFSNSGANHTFGGVGHTQNTTDRPAFGGARPDSETHGNAGTRPTFHGSDAGRPAFDGGHTNGTSGRTFGGVGGGRPAFDSSTSRPSSSDRGSRPAFGGTNHAGRTAPQSTDNTTKGTNSTSGDAGSHPAFSGGRDGGGNHGGDHGSRQ